ncbi:MAG TPA: hypothetical protein VFQ53_06675 [Kofleriaceae bacterium]|nr:hypothetical protein [Kofleriaceae bacterium]
MDTQTRAPAVLDDGTGVYLWGGTEPYRADEEWVFKAMFRCDRCNRAVTVVRYAGDHVEHHWLRSLRTCCPGGCASVTSWLPAR